MMNTRTNKGLMSSFLLILSAGLLLSSCASAEVRAVRRGNIEDLQKYVADGGDVNAVQDNGQSLLHIAVQYGQLNSLSFLLESGARPDPRDASGATPLMYSMQQGRVDMGQILLQRGADPFATDSRLQNSLFYAVRGNRLDSLEFLLGLGLDPETLDGSRRSLLHELSSNDQTAMAQRLIDEGVDLLSISSDNNESILHRAAASGADALLDLYVKGPAGVHVNLRDRQGNLPLHKAMRTQAGASASLRSMQVLLAAGSDVNAPDGSDLRPLEFAVRQLDAERTGLLLEYGAVQEDLPHLLLISIDRGDEAIARLLLDYGANPDHIGPDGDTPLLRAVKKEMVGMVNILVQYGAQVNAFDAKGQSALLISLDQSAGGSAGLNETARLLAARGAVLPNVPALLHPVMIKAVTNGNKAVTELLLANNVSASIGDSQRTPLIILAARASNLEIAQVLIQYGASIHSRDALNNTAILVASEASTPELVQYLLLAGANPNDRNSRNETPWQKAALNPRVEEIRRLLLLAGAIPETEPEPAATSDSNNTTQTKDGSGTVSEPEPGTGDTLAKDGTGETSGIEVPDAPMTEPRTAPTGEQTTETAAETVEPDAEDIAEQPPQDDADDISQADDTPPDIEDEAAPGRITEIRPTDTGLGNRARILYPDQSIPRNSSGPLIQFQGFANSLPGQYPANLRSTPSGRRNITLKIGNESDSTAELFWIDNEGTPVALYRISENEIIELPVQQGEIFLLFTPDGRYFGDIRTGGSSLQEFRLRETR